MTVQEMIDQLNSQPDKTIPLRIKINISPSFVPQPERSLVADVERILSVTTPGARFVEVIAYEK